MDVFDQLKLEEQKVKLNTNGWIESFAFLGFGAGVNSFIGIIVAAIIFVGTFSISFGNCNFNFPGSGSNSSGSSIASNSQSGEVAYVDAFLNNLVVTAKGSQIASISTTQTAMGVALSPDGNTAYIIYSNFDSSNILSVGIGELDVVSIQLKSVIASIPIGGLPTAVVISPNGQYAYVAFASLSVPGSISVVDLSSNKITNTFSASSTDTGASLFSGSYPVGLAISADGSLLYVLNNGDGIFGPGANPTYGTLSVISTKTFQTVKSISVGKDPQFLSISPDGSKLAVGNYFDSTITMIDLTSYLTNTISVQSGVTALAFLPNGSQLLVSSGSDPALEPLPSSHKYPDNLSIVDVNSGKIVKEITTPNSVVGVTVLGNSCYFIYGYQAGLGILDLSSYKLTTSGPMNLGTK
ncbi:MAG: hypothetical protein HKL80_03420 [Acidimicrobiales bacterium]|nr:hypothetical protein [Acidimicrobiales bacterium]